ncbi:MAG: biopolymer transporter ExbD [Phycisphaerales bacterium]|nr:biopolymer transporter ExbD [Phycisphaerales bacterium]
MLNVIPLVDITFLLMIFFVIAGTFNSLEGLLGAGLTPVRAGAGGPPVPFMPIVIRILSTGAGTGAVSLEVEPSGATPATFAELSEALLGISRQPGFDAQTPVIVQADDGVLWDQAVEGWNAALRAGFVNLAYADPPNVADPLRP